MAPMELFNRGLPSITDPYDFQNYAKVKETAGDPATNFIPRKYNDLTFLTPDKFWYYDPTNPDNTDKTKEPNRYTNLRNFIFTRASPSYRSGTGNGFMIADHSKPASLIFKKIAFADGKWIDMVYTVKLLGPTGPGLTGIVRDFASYKSTGTSVPGRDVYLNIGNPAYGTSTAATTIANNKSSWMNMTAYGTAFPRNYLRASEAARWQINIKFVEDRSTEDDPTPDETDDPAVDLSGNYQIFNLNTRKIIAFDRDDLDLTGNGSGNQIWAINKNDGGPGSPPLADSLPHVKGHTDSLGQYFELWGDSTDNSGTDTRWGIDYLFDHGKLNFTAIRSGSTDAVTAMYTNTSNNPLIRAEVPYASLNTTHNRLGTLYDSTGNKITTTSDKIKYTPRTVQFNIMQKFPPQPDGVSPTNFDVKDLVAPKYVNIDLSKIDIQSLTSNPVDAMVNDQTQTLTGPISESDTTNKYSYNLDTSKFLSTQFDGFKDNFIRADLNFDMDWDTKDSIGNYPWRADLKKESDGDYVGVKLSGTNMALYRNDKIGTNCYPTYTKVKDSTGNGQLNQTYTSYVKVPKQTYNFEYINSANNTPINRFNTSTPSITSESREIGQTYDESDKAPRYLTDTANKDYEFKKAVLIDEKGTETPISPSDLKNLAYHYDDGKDKTIRLYYDGAVSRTTFHYWGINDATGNSQKIDPVNYYRNPNIVGTLPTDLYQLKTITTNFNYTIGSYVNPTTIREEIPTLDFDKKIINGLVSPTNQVNQDDYDPTGRYYTKAPAPSLPGQRYLGYYQYYVGDTTATFHPYDQNDKNNDTNNAWANEKYTNKNQVIVYAYVSTSTDGRSTLNVDPNIDFGKGLTLDTKRLNQDSFSLKLGNKFTYLDPSFKWPDRNWQVNVAADNLQNDNGTSAPPGSKITFDKPQSIYDHVAVSDNTTKVNTALSQTFDSGFTLNLDGNETSLLNVLGLSDTTNLGVGPYLKSESLTLNWNKSMIHLEVPQNISGGHYKAKVTWTVKNSL